MQRRHVLQGFLAGAIAGATRPARAAAVPGLEVLGAPNASTIVLVRMIESGALQPSAPGATFRLWRDPDELRAGVASGRTRLFSTPNHVPALFANRGVPVRLLAVISMGHLYIVAQDPAITSLAALRGQRVTAFFRNDMPDLVFRALLRREGLEPGRDVGIDYVATPMEAAQLAIAGRAPIALLSEPPATMAIAMAGHAGRTLHRAVNLQAEWGRHFGQPRIPMAGIALHQSLIDESPELLAALRQGLPEAAAWAQANPAEAGALAERRMDIRAPLFARALPHFSIGVYGARTLKAELMDFYRVLLELHPEAIGGRLPDDDFFLDL
ncbi:ABC transporter substrate-binding protein [Rhodovastum atsumiense]|uniref:ABC transporter substrate-binding protein n=1 Tax=Rhodovastum atsumiense TaxID=504468 RepID=UPI00193C780A|nr:ABC transporter substrate-binding protein [Rhodovastum atsumiense]CAH2603266.1 ABC transporter substrate-binding protein [Rhodovastum atsumiense]